MKLCILAVLIAAILCAIEPAHAQDKTPIRIGIIGLDTSHVPEFTALFNNAKGDADSAALYHLAPAFKVVAGFPGGSKDVKASYSRVDMFTKQLQDKWGVEIVDSI